MIYCMCFLFLQEQTILFMVRSHISSSSSHPWIPCHPLIHLVKKANVIVSHLQHHNCHCQCCLKWSVLHIRKWWPRPSQPAGLSHHKSVQSTSSDGQDSTRSKHKWHFSKPEPVWLWEAGKSEKKTEISYRCLTFSRITAVYIILSWDTGVTRLSSLTSPELFSRLRQASVSRHYYGMISIFYHDEPFQCRQEFHVLISSHS